VLSRSNNQEARTGGSLFVQHALSTSILSVLGRAIGFLIPYFVARWFGVIPETDAVFFAYSLIIFFGAVFTSVLDAAVIPFVAELRAQGRDISKLVSSVLGFGTLILLVGTAAFIVLMRSVTGLLTPFSETELQVFRTAVLIIAPNCVLATWAALFAGVLNAHKRFWVPAVSPTLRTSVCLILILLLRDSLGAYSIAVGYLAGEAVRLVFLVVCAMRVPGLRVSFSLRSDRSLLEFARFSMLAGLAYLAGAFSPIVDRVIASWTGPGGVTLLEYADRLFYVPVAFFVPVLGVVLFSHWSERFHRERGLQFRKHVVVSVVVVAVVSLATSAVLFLFRMPITSVAYLGGRFPSERLTELADVFGLYTLKLCPAMVGLVFTNVFFIWKRTRVILYNNIVAAVLNLLLDILFVRVLGLGLKGIAISSICVSVWLALFYLLLAMRSANWSPPPTSQSS